MSQFIIRGGKPLRGVVRASGNKNSVLKLMAATILTREECLLENVPEIRDVSILAKIMQSLGVEVKREKRGVWRFLTKKIETINVDPDLASQLRASIVLLGPLLGRTGRVKLPHPGGDLIGRRGVGTHFDALKSLGAKIRAEKGFYLAEAKKPHPADIFLDEASVTATENAMMLAATLPGETIIRDAAAEPHVVDLAELLIKMGARIEGAGTNLIKIWGRESLSGAKHRVRPDHIDVGTFAIAAAATGGQVKIEDALAEDLQMISLYLERTGVMMKQKGTTLEVFPSKLVVTQKKVQTRPWPGFPTDLMSPFIVLATQARGQTICHDWMYGSRMFFVDKLISMGAEVTIADPHRVLVYGPTKLRGQHLISPDIRAGMALVIAAMVAEGKSQIDHAEIIDRGYENVDGRLRQLGADIKRVGDEHDASDMG